MRKYLILVSSLSVLFILLACSCNSGTNNPNGPGSTDLVNYHISGDTLIAITPLAITENKSCNGDTLATRLDTTGGDTSSFIYSLSVDSLTINSLVGNLNRSGIYSRIGTGTGLVGTWALVGGRQQLPGTLGDTIIVTSLQIIPYGSGTTVSSFADQFISRWNRCTPTRSCDSSLYNIIVTKISDNSIQLSGNKTGETVTIYQDGQGNRTSSSTNAAHFQYTYYVQPVTCPDPLEPQWYQDFLTANVR